MLGYTSAREATLEHLHWLLSGRYQPHLLKVKRCHFTEDWFAVQINLHHLDSSQKRTDRREHRIKLGVR